MCEPSADGHTTCVCPETCPELESPEPVCSSYGVEFSSACEMHKFACRLEIMMTVKSKGHCDGEIEIGIVLARWFPNATRVFSQLHKRFNRRGFITWKQVIYFVYKIIRGKNKRRRSDAHVSV